MLFQPTNITPDIINGIGNGYVISGQSFNVSWQVNGNSPMVAYQIFFYQNNTASTAVANTGKITLSEPFSGVDYQGNVQFFTAEITSSSIINALSGGSTYKMMIRQYYTSSAYIDQRSMSVFNCTTRPTLTIRAKDGDGNVIFQHPTMHGNCGTRNFVLEGTLTGNSSNTVIAWARWEVYVNKTVGGVTSEHTVYDSEKIYGTSDLKLEYDGMLNNTSYVIRLTVENAFGVQVKREVLVHATWEEGELPVDSSVCKVGSQSTAMRIAWNGNNIINGEPENAKYSFENGFLKLESGAIVWSEQSGRALNLPDPWALLMRFRLKQGSVSPILRATMDGVTAEVNYALGNREMSYNINGSGSIDSIVAYDADVIMLITPEEIMFKWRQPTGGLVPSMSLTPSDSLTPKDATGIVEYIFQDGLSYTQSALHEIRISGALDVDYIQILSEYTEEELASLYETDFNYKPETDSTYESAVFNLDFFDQTLDAGSLKIGQYQIQGWAVYRKKDTEFMAIHLLDVPLRTQSIYDYGCGSRSGDYQYTIYPIGGNKYLTDGIKTRQTNPVFENWSLIEAEKMESGYYSVINEFVFGKNLKSGSISNNNNPSVYQNFTQYPTVMLSNVLYQSGTLNSLIGQISYFSYVVQKGDTLENIALRFHTTTDKILEDNESLSNVGDLTVGLIIKIKYINGIGQYWDDIKLRDDIWNLSRTKNALFLKSRKGDVMEVRISAPITAEVEDGAVSQPVTVSIPWVQVNDATHTAIIGVV